MRLAALLAEVCRTFHLLSRATLPFLDSRNQSFIHYGLSKELMPLRVSERLVSTIQKLTPVHLLQFTYERSSTSLTHTLTITCTCCFDGIYGAQDLKIYSHADSPILSQPLSLSLCLSVSLWLLSPSVVTAITTVVIVAVASTRSLIVALSGTTDGAGSLPAVGLGSRSNQEKVEYFCWSTSQSTLHSSAISHTLHPPMPPTCCMPSGCPIVCTWAVSSHGFTLVCIVMVYLTLLWRRTLLLCTLLRLALPW